MTPTPSTQPRSGPIGEVDEEDAVPLGLQPGTSGAGARPSPLDPSLWLDGNDFGAKRARNYLPPSPCPHPEGETQHKPRRRNRRISMTRSRSRTHSRSRSSSPVRPETPAPAPHSPAHFSSVISGKPVLQLRVTNLTPRDMPDLQSRSQGDYRTCTTEAGDLLTFDYRSVKCSQCGNIFKNRALAYFHTEKSGHDQFEEFIAEIEKEQKLAELREKVAEKRVRKAAEDAKETKANEFIRCKAGNEAARIEEDLKKRQFLKELETMRRRENENNKKALAAIRAQIEADKRERAQKAVQEKALRDGKATARGPATATIAATASTAAPVTSSLPGREFPETRLQIRLASVGVPITTTLRSDATLWEVAEFIAGRVLSLDANTVTISQFQHFPRKAFLPSDFSRTLRDIGLTPSAILMVSALPARGTHTPLLSYPNLSPTMIAGEQPLSEGKKVEPQLEREPKLDPAAVAAEAEKAAKAATEAERVAEAEKAASAAAEADRAAKENAAKAAAEAERISKEKVAKAAAEAERAAKAEKVVKAEKFKEQGNEKFKHKRYIEAIDLYTKAIDLVSTEPVYLANRAAAHISIKCFRAALDDCQLANTLQTAQTAPTTTGFSTPPKSKSEPPFTPTNAPTPKPQTKTLLRLARCQLALAQTAAALSTLRSVLSSEPANAQATQMQTRALELEAQVHNLELSCRRREWSMAWIALERCLGAVEAEGSEIPIEWRIRWIEIELAQGNWDGANSAVDDALRVQSNSPDVLTLRGLVLFLCAQLPEAMKHAQVALRYDPDHEPAQRLHKRAKEVYRLKEEGKHAFNLGKLHKALRMYTEALERVGDNEDEGKGGHLRALLLSNRATILVNLIRYDHALIDIEASLLLRPRSFNALRTRARIRLHKWKFEGAIVDFCAALEQAEFESADEDVRTLRDELKWAEAARKRSKDRYKILGVSRDCDEANIRKAYLRESLEHHPDKGGNEERFKLIVEAYSVLSDPHKREQYDHGDVG